MFIDVGQVRVVVLVVTVEAEGAAEKPGGRS
jgi:hypothetical protein